MARVTFTRSANLCGERSAVAPHAAAVVFVLRRGGHHRFGSDTVVALAAGTSIAFHPSFACARARCGTRAPLPLRLERTERASTGRRANLRRAPSSMTGTVSRVSPLISARFDRVSCARGRRRWEKRGSANNVFGTRRSGEQEGGSGSGTSTWPSQYENVRGRARSRCASSLTESAARADGEEAPVRRGNGISSSSSRGSALLI